METRVDLNSSQFALSLIGIVQANAALLNSRTRFAPYSLKKLRKDTWISIATSLKVEPKICLLKWKELVSRYGREKMLMEDMKRADWPLFNSMNYFYKNYACPRRAGASNARQDSDGSFKAVFFDSLSTDADDFLQEAMDEQGASTATTEATNQMPSSSTTAIAAQPPPALPELSTQANATSSIDNGVMRRIASLLEGLDASSRRVAENRIIAYLCQCHLNTFRYESIEDIRI